jgi:hypothetical protein
VGEPFRDIGQGSTRSIDDVVPDDDTRIAVRSGNVARAPVNGAKMPNRCVVCNAPARGFKMRRTFYWHPPEVYFALLLCGLPYVIFALIMRKRATIAFGVCKKHRARRHNGILVGFGGGLLGFAMVCSGSLPLVVMGAFMLLILPISGALLARTIHAARIDEKWVWLRVGRPFLESLPRGPGSF